jgi:cytochrome c biogenesis protein CcdA
MLKKNISIAVCGSFAFGHVLIPCLFEFVYQKLRIILILPNYVIIIMLLKFYRDLKALALRERQAKALKGQAQARCQTLALNLQNPNPPPQQERALLSPGQAPGKGAP